MIFSGTKIAIVTGLPENPLPNQFYLVEFAGSTEFYLSNSKAQLFLLNGSAEELVLFNHLTTKTTISTALEDLWTDELTGGLVNHDGDEIKLTYCGNSNGDANDKQIIVNVADSPVIDVTLNDNDFDWKLNVVLLRTSSTSFKFSSEFLVAGYSVIKVGEITGLDLDTLDYNIVLQAHTPSEVGGMTVTMAKAVYKNN